MNYLYIPELNNLVINIDNMSNLYIEYSGYDYKDWLRVGYIKGDDTKYLITKNNIDQVKYRLDMFFLNKDNNK